MQALDQLIQDARDVASGQRGASAAVSEVERQMKICNACRYCEGFCAVFPAMTRRLEFSAPDVHYMANLCHNCGACLHACQYAPPHAFAVNVPQAMAKVRAETYVAYAWPAALGKLYWRNGLTVSLAMVVALACFLSMTLYVSGNLWGDALQGNFFNLYSHNALVTLFAPVFLWALLALGIGVTRFLGDVKQATTGKASEGVDALNAGKNVLQLTYLDGGHGQGCHNEDDAYTLSRARAHHLTFYGFMLCFAATGVATIYHYVFGLHAPYDLPSLPKLLGVIGGCSLLLGSVRLLMLKWRRHPLHGDAAQNGMDYGFVALLIMTSASGLLLWLGRQTPALTLLLSWHLAAVMALFITLPYGKFAHGIFRSAALLRYAVERRQPSSLALGDD